MMYLQNHLVQAHRAVAGGYPLHGYFLWSRMDNFEWACGYTRRFGLCYFNYETMERTPKLSAQFYSDVIRRNAVGGELPPIESTAVNGSGEHRRPSPTISN